MNIKLINIIAVTFCNSPQLLMMCSNVVIESWRSKLRSDFSGLMHV